MFCQGVILRHGMEVRGKGRGRRWKDEDGDEWKGKVWRLGMRNADTQGKKKGRQLEKRELTIRNWKCRYTKEDRERGKKEAGGSDRQRKYWIWYNYVREGTGIEEARGGKCVCVGGGVKRTRPFATYARSFPRLLAMLLRNLWDTLEKKHKR